MENHSDDTKPYLEILSLDNLSIVHLNYYRHFNIQKGQIYKKVEITGS